MNAPHSIQLSSVARARAGAVRLLIAQSLQGGTDGCTQPCVLSSSSRQLCDGCQPPVISLPALMALVASITYLEK